MAKVFISYSHVDQDLVVRLRDYLRHQSDHSVDPFLDSDIPLGAAWSDALREQLEAAEFLVAVMPAVVSGPVLVELEIASELEKQGKLRIIPALLKDRQPPIDIRMTVARLQHVVLDPDRLELGFERILENVMGAAKLEEQFVAAGDDYRKASAIFQKLERLPSWRGRARAHMAAFWDRAALHLATAEDRDRALLAWLEAAVLESSEQRLREASDLIGEDGSTLVMTYRGPKRDDPLRSFLGALFKPKSASSRT